MNHALGLRIVIMNIGPLDMILPETEARQFVEDFESGAWAVRDVKRIGGTTVDGVRWAVRTDLIASLVTYKLEQAKQAPRGLSPGLGGSGGRN